MMQLKQGDKCRVRLFSGLIAEALYEHPAKFCAKGHWVKVGDVSLLAQRFKPSESGTEYCRFVGNAGVRE